MTSHLPSVHVEFQTWESEENVRLCPKSRRFKAQYSFLQGLRKFVCYCAGGHQEVGASLGQRCTPAAKGCIWLLSICIPLLCDSLATAGETKGSRQYPVAPPHTTAYPLPFASGLGFSTTRSCLDSLFLCPKESSTLGSAGGQGQGQREPTSNPNPHGRPSASIRH